MLAQALIFLVFANPWAWLLRDLKDGVKHARTEVVEAASRAEKEFAAVKKLVAPSPQQAPVFSPNPGTSGGSLTITGPSPWIDVTAPMYGATPNDDSDDDGPAFRAARDDADDTDGSVIFIPAGTYHFDTVDPETGGAGVGSYWRFLNRTHIIVRGAGMGKTILKVKDSAPVSPGDPHFIKCDGASHLQFYDFTVDMNDTNVTYPGEQSHAFYFRLTTFTDVERCEMTDMRGDGAFFVAPVSVPQLYSEKINIKNCYIHDGNRSGVALQGGVRDVHIDNNVFSRFSDQAFDSEATGSRPAMTSIWVTNNVWEHNNDLVWAISGESEDNLADELYFLNNTVRLVDAHDQTNVQIGRVAGLWMIGNTIPGQIKVQRDSENIRLENNSVTIPSGSSDDGILITVLTSRPSNIRVDNNWIFQNGTGDGIELNAPDDSIRVTSNRLIGNTGANRGIFYNLLSSGLTIDASRITDNTVMNFATTGIDIRTGNPGTTTLNGFIVSDNIVWADGMTMTNGYRLDDTPGAFINNFLFTNNVCGQGVTNCVVNSSGETYAIAGQVGHVNISIGSGSPEGVLARPVGSVYFDRTNGPTYEKRSGGSTSSGWSKRFTAADGTGSESKVVTADAAGTDTHVMIWNSNSGAGSAGFAYDDIARLSQPNTLTDVTTFQDRVVIDPATVTFASPTTTIDVSTRNKFFLPLTDDTELSISNANEDTQPVTLVIIQDSTPRAVTYDSTIVDPKNIATSSGSTLNLNTGSGRYTILTLVRDNSLGAMRIEGTTEPVAVTIWNNYGPFITGNLSASDSTTYYADQAYGGWNAAAGGFVITARIYVSAPGTLTRVRATHFVGGTNGTNETVTYTVYKNGSSTGCTFTTTWDTGSTITDVTKTDCSVDVAAGDYLTLAVTTPAWATNPTNVRVNYSFGIQQDQ